MQSTRLKQTGKPLTTLTEARLRAPDRWKQSEVPLDSDRIENRVTPPPPPPSDRANLMLMECLHGV